MLELELEYVIDDACLQIIQALTMSEQPNLKLTVTKQVSKDRCKLVVYQQGNAQATRKQILPIIQSAAVAI